LSKYCKNNITSFFILVTLLIISTSYSCFSQSDSTRFTPTIPDSSSTKMYAKDSSGIKIDTLYTTDESFKEKATFTARDSVYGDMKQQRIYLYGDAKVHYNDIDLTADYIEIDLKSHEILASYTYDKDSVKIGSPVVKMDGQELEAGKIKMNYETKKAFIREVKIKQEENYLYMEVAKRQANEEIHFKKGRFTTCDLPEPHYHFQLSRAILIPNKRIVSGPMNIWIKNVPTPLGFPFAIIPQKSPKERTHGFLFPQFVPVSQYGMGIQNLGYFIPINDTVQTTIYGSIYSRGSWGLSNQTEYKLRYKFSGTLFAGFEQFKQPFPSKRHSNKLTIRWSHRQDPKANPYWNFNASVNFESDNNAKNNINPLNVNYFNNTFNSDINLTRSFPGKPVTMGLKVALNQNSTSHNLMFTAPTFSTNVTRFYPFKIFRKSKVGGAKWYEQIGMTYNLEVKNMSTFKDSLLRTGDFAAIGRTFYNGINQNAGLQTTVSIFKNALKLTPSFNYRNTINFQQIRKNYDASSSTVLIDTLQKVGVAQQLTVDLNATTVLYGYYRFVGKKKTLLRHVMTPTVGYRYIPMLNQKFQYVYNNQEVAYSPFERSLYSTTTTRSQSIITYGLNNTLELKRKSDRDTITGYKKTRIIDALSITGNYDMLRDSMKLSDFNLNLRISPFDFVSFVANGTFSPYSWNDQTGRTINEFAVKDRKVLGRFTSVNFNTTFTIASKKSQQRIQETKDLFGQYWNSDFQYYSLHPEMYLDFEIPWKVNVGHIYSVMVNQNKTPENPKTYLPTHTITVNGDISLTKRWKISATMYYDVKSNAISNLRVDLVRDMHCWRMSVNWIPIGFNKSFMVTIMGTSSMLSSAKVRLQKPPGIPF